MKRSSIQYTDIELLIKLYSENPAIPYIFDPYNKLKYSEGEETLTEGGSQILVNLGGKLIEFKGMPLESFDLILDFGKTDVPENFNCKPLNYINQNEGYMRWIYQGANLKSVLSFYNSSGKRGKLIAKAIRLCSQLGLQKLARTGSFKILSKESLKLDNKIADDYEDYSIFMGTPGVQRSILVALIENNEVSQFLKISTNEASAKLIRHEKEAILSLNEIESSYFITPALHATDSNNELRMENLQQSNSIRTAEFTSLHANSIAETLNCQASSTILNKSEFWNQTKSVLETSSFSTNPQLRELGKTGRKLMSLMNEQIKVWTNWAHGDFTPWNMVINENRIALYDWELFRNQAPALFDLFHFHYQKGILMDRASVDEIQMEIADSLQAKVLKQSILDKDIDVQLYHRLYLLITIGYFTQVFDKQDLNLQNKWQIEAWLAALNTEFHLLRTENNCRKHFILDLNDALEQIPHAFLKFDFNNLLDLPESSDLDIAIEKYHINEVVNFCDNSHLVKRYTHRKKSFMSILEIHLLDNSYLSLDLIFNFKRKDVTILSLQDVLKNRCTSKKGLMVPALKHDLAYAYAFYTLNDSTIPLRYHKHFSTDAKQDAVSYVNKSYGTSFSSLGKIFTEGKTGKKSIRESLKSSSLKAKINYIKDTLKDLVYNQGFMITFSGVDGAGKSTIIDIVKENIEKKYRKEVVLLRHRPGILPILSAIKHGKVKAEKIAGHVLPRKGKNKSSISSILRFGYYYLDYLLGQVYVYLKYILRGKIVLYDRYYFDFINDAKRSNIQVNKKVATALYRFVMKPKLNIFLYAEAETILARKQELNATDITEMTKNYKSLFTDLKENSKNSRYTCIENNELDETIAAVLKEVAIVA